MKKILLIAVALLCGIMMQGQGIYQLWGTTTNGGKSHDGSIFNTDAKGNNYRLKHQFNHFSESGFNATGSVEEHNGKMYGMTTKGGSYDAGVIFEWNPSTKIYTKKIDFDIVNGSLPFGNLTLYNEKFYGTTYESSGSGVIFEWNPTTNVYVNKIDFATDNDGEGPKMPSGTLIEMDGKFYGVTVAGGVNDVGTIFEWNPETNKLQKKFDFGDSNGIYPYGSLSVYEKKIYGTTGWGGKYGAGIIFEWDPKTNTFLKKIDFDISNGSTPSSQLLLEYGKFYGTTPTGGLNDAGVIFEWNPATNIFIKKIDFGDKDGQHPQGSLSLWQNKMYGTTTGGGNSNVGVIFEWDPKTNDYTKKFDFNLTDGAYSHGVLKLSSSGIFYGVTQSGGLDHVGVIFSWDPRVNVYHKEFDFSSTSAGTFPMGGLVMKNNLYGMTATGGRTEQGVIFEWNTRSNSYFKKIDLAESTGSHPMGDLVLLNEKMYGVTSTGGQFNTGVIFEWNPVTNIFEKKFDFDNISGSTPLGTLTTLNGRLYGMTNSGGKENNGVIFEWNPLVSIFNKKFDFDSAQGMHPFKSKLTELNGKFYGLTSAGGSQNGGVIFEWNPATNLYSKKIDFNGADGKQPMNSLTFYNGKFYGLTYLGGSKNGGVIFEWNPVTNVYKKRFDFDTTNGFGALGNLTMSKGNFYGTTSMGGKYNAGVIFEWNPDHNSYTKKFEFNRNEEGWGATPTSELILIQASVSYGSPSSCTTFPSITIDPTNNNQWVSITDDENNAVAEIKANGNNLGIVTASMFINSGAVRKDNTNKFYLDRNISITSQVKPVTPVDVRLYIKASEYETLKNAANVSDQPKLIDSIADIKIYTTNANCTSVTSSLTNAVATTAENWENDYVLSAKVSALGSFFFAPATTCTPPIISNMLISTDTLWPPSHSFRGISVAYRTSGDCKCNPVTRWLTVKSNEPVSGISSGDKSPDWIIKDANHLKLRAERNPHGSGRVYTITINAKNTEGYLSTYDFTVAVPLNMSPAQEKALAAKESITAEEDEPGEIFNCQVAPNPSGNYFNLEVSSVSGKKIDVTLLDMGGRMITTFSYAKNQPIRFGSDLKPGVYMIKITQSDQQKIIKIIKQ